VDRRHVRTRETVVKILDEFRAELGRPFLVDVRIVDDQFHPERVQPFGDLLADPAEADDPQRRTVQLRPEILRFGPLPLSEPGVCLRDRPRRRERHRYRVLSGRTDVPLRRVRDHHAVTRRRVHVNVVDADPCPADDHQLRGRFEHGFGDVRPRADDQRVHVSDGVE